MRGKILFLMCAVLLAVPSGIARGQSSDVSGLLKRADKYEEDGKYKDAEAIYKGIAEAYAGKEDGLKAQQKLVCLYIERGGTAEAEAAYQELLSEYGDHKEIAEAVDDVADAYRHVEKYDKALEIYSYIVDAWSDSEQAMGSQGCIARVNIKLGREEAAQAALKKLIGSFSSNGDMADVVDGVADEYREVRKYEKALQLYKYVVDSWPESEQAMGSQEAVAQLYIELGDDPNAQAAVEKLIAEFADRDDIAEVVDNVGDEYREVKKYEKALQLYKYIVDSWPKSEHAVGTQRSIVKLYIELGDDPNAQAAIDKLVTKFSGNPDLPDALAEIANSYENEERYEEAKSFYEQLIKRDPNSSEAQKADLDTQLLLIKDGSDTAAGLEAIDKFIADFNEHPDLSSAIYSIEKAYYIRIAADYSLREDFLNAVKVWEKVKTKFPDFFYDDPYGDPDLYYFIGDCYRHLGEYEKAIQHYGIAAANWTVNGYAVVPHVVVPLPSESSGDYIGFHVLIDSLIADFGEDPGLAATILRTGHEYRRRANDARREGLNTEAEVDNLKAIALYDRVINEFGSSAFVASSYFFSALSFRDLGQWQDTLDCCNHLLDNWPEYKYASWARRLAQNCSERLAAQVQ